MKRIFISGMAPGNGGVPNFLEYLESNNFPLITPNQSSSFFTKILNRLIFLMKIMMCPRDKTYVIIHHQTIPLLAIVKLLLFNKLEYFAIDNSYFCISSYNYNPKLNIENPCRNCLHKTQPDKSCIAFPSRRKKFIEIILLKLIRKYFSKSTSRIFTLSDSSTSLVKKSLPSCGSVKTIGYSTNDLIKLIDEPKNNNSKKVNKTIVFHGHCIPGKGYDYLLKLAKDITDFEFIFPTEGVDFENVRYVQCTWDNGLKDLAEEATYVAVPSLWDNTPEAASLKTMLMEIPLLFVPSEFSFENENSSHFGIALTGNIKDDVHLIRKGINKDIHSKSKDYCRKFLKESEQRLLNLK